jgi:ribosome-binding protein aMBF1 (putative translation factor)
MSIKDRRKALGWNRAQLAQRCAIDRRVMQLVELGQWSEADALERVETVLSRAEAGETDVQLTPPRPPQGS